MSDSEFFGGEIEKDVIQVGMIADDREQNRVRQIYRNVAFAFVFRRSSLKSKINNDVLERSSMHIDKND